MPRKKDDTQFEYEKNEQIKYDQDIWIGLYFIADYCEWRIEKDKDLVGVALYTAALADCKSLMSLLPENEPELYPNPHPYFNNVYEHVGKLIDYVNEIKKKVYHEALQQFYDNITIRLYQTQSDILNAETDHDPRRDKCPEDSICDG